MHLHHKFQLPYAYNKHMGKTSLCQVWTWQKYTHSSAQSERNSVQPQLDDRGITQHRQDKGVEQETYKKSHVVKERGHPLVMHQKAASYAPRLQKIAVKTSKYQYKKIKVVPLWLNQYKRVQSKKQKKIKV
jgi:hypothetical protein